jgi:post-segregation antitoxin (ccd killing protein)
VKKAVDAWEWKLTLSVDDKIVQNAELLNINISTFLEVRLVDYMSPREECGRRDLNPSFKLGKLK